MGRCTSYPKEKFTLKDNVLFCRRDGEERWKAMLPLCLEQKVIEYTHTELGHLGVDKCTRPAQ